MKDTLLDKFEEVIKITKKNKCKADKQQKGSNLNSGTRKISLDIQKDYKPWGTSNEYFMNNNETESKSSSNTSIKRQNPIKKNTIKSSFKSNTKNKEKDTSMEKKVRIVTPDPINKTKTP